MRKRAYSDSEHRGDTLPRVPGDARCARQARGRLRTCSWANRAGRWKQQAEMIWESKFPGEVIARRVPQIPPTTPRAAVGTRKSGRRSATGTSQTRAAEGNDRGVGGPAKLRAVTQ